jgi:ABC-type dipeptide/oligopeptide/nickel transport system permease subunit
VASAIFVEAAEVLGAGHRTYSANLWSMLKGGYTYMPQPVPSSAMFRTVPPFNLLADGLLRGVAPTLRQQCKT